MEDNIELTLIHTTTGMNVPVAASYDDVRDAVEGCEDYDEIIHFAGVEDHPVSISRRIIGMFSPAEIRRESGLAIPNRPNLLVPS